MAGVTRTEYSPLEIREALTTLAYLGGNSFRASKETGIASSTLRDWRTAIHRDLYLEICQREGPRIEQLAADQARELVVRSSDVEHGIVDALQDRLTETLADEPKRDDFATDSAFETAYDAWVRRGSAKELSELAGALQRVTTSKGINTTKLLELTGRPTQVVQHLSPQEAIRGLARDLGVTLDSTAEEIHEPTPLNP